MKKILYIGNKLAIHGKPPTTIDYLSVKLQEEGYQVITASSKRNKILRLLEMVFVTIQNRKKVQYVLIDTYSTQNFYYALIVAFLCRFFKLSYIPILHGGNLPMRLKKNKKISQALLGKAFINVAPSRYMLEQFKNQGFKNVTYIPNTLEIQNYPFMVREKITRKLLWVRSFSEIYNPLLALEIVEIFKKKEFPVTLCMVGPDKDGSLQYCKKIASDLNLPITFTGLLKKVEWIALAKEFDIFINTTNVDNMPISVMEAMALGLPVVSTQAGGMPFLIANEKNGMLVPSKNAKAFVEAIDYICENPSKAREFTENARKSIEEFNWQNVKYKWITILNS